MAKSQGTQAKQKNWVSGSIGRISELGSRRMEGESRADAKTPVGAQEVGLLGLLRGPTMNGVCFSELLFLFHCQLVSPPCPHHPLIQYLQAHCFCLLTTAMCSWLLLPPFYFKALSAAYSVQTLTAHCPVLSKVLSYNS